MPEPSHRQPSQDHPQAFAIGIHDVHTGPPHEGELGEGVLLQTDRGEIQAILHQALEAQRGGSGSGVLGGLAAGPRRLCAARGRAVGTRSPPRLCYRHPNVLPECALDVMAGVAYLDVVPRAVCGPCRASFGGAVVMTRAHCRVWRASWP